MEIIRRHFLFLFIIISFSALSAQQKENSEAANKEFISGNYSKSAELYKEYLSKEENMKDGQSWLNFAFSSFQLGNYEEALKSFLKAEELGALGSLRAVVQTAASFLITNNKEKAYEYLEKAVNGGLPPGAIKNNPNLDSIREEERFKKLVMQSEEIAYPCRNNPLNRQFDFWLGEWDVHANGQKVGESKIEYSLEGCLLIENYTASSGYSGKSLNFYDDGDKKWHQIYTDNGGNISRYSGELKDGKMYFRGENTGPKGSKSLVRMEFTSNGDGSVRQLYEGSTDDGKTWSVYFDGLYIKKQ